MHLLPEDTIRKMSRMRLVKNRRMWNKLLRREDKCNIVRKKVNLKEKKRTTNKMIYRMINKNSKSKR